MVGLFLLLVAAAPTVRVQTSEGEAIEAPLHALNAQHVVLGEPDALRTLELAAVQSLVNIAAESSAAPEYSIGLRGGSVVAFRELETDEAGTGLQIRTRTAGSLTVALDDVRWIRFQPSRQAADERWNAFVAQDRPADMLVIRRSSGALDAIKGVVEGIDQEKVQFNLDGQQIAAPRDRLEGVLFRDVTGQRDQAETAIAEVSDREGSRWAATDLRYAADATEDPGTLQLTTVGNQTIELNLSDVPRIQFASGSIALSELQPISQFFRPFFDIGLESETAAKLAIGGRSEGGANEVTFSGRMTLEYRIPQDAKRFRTRFIAAAPGGAVTITLTLDGKTAQSITLDADTPESTVALDLDEASRLKIDYDGFAASGVGDRVIMAGPRFLQ